jgi:hypothetical protein
MTILTSELNTARVKHSSINQQGENGMQSVRQLRFAKFNRVLMALLLVLGMTILGVGCVRSEHDRAEESLVQYFSHLHDGEYERAAALYGGEYELLQQWNMDVDPADRARLLELGCMANNLQCLEILDIGAYEIASADTYEFWVQFEAPDGGVFQMQSQGQVELTSTFKFTVVKKESGYVVMELPIYVP